MKLLLTLISLILLASCAVYAKDRLDDIYGREQVRERLVDKHAAIEYFRDVKPILDNRCVVCHGCYDAPCQLKLSAFEGIDRGASKTKVYDGVRLLATQPSRLFVDANSTEEWRQRDFYPVLNERHQDSQSNVDGSVLYQMLLLKQQHPLPETTQLDASFDFQLNRDQQCPAIEEFDRYKNKYPLWGMPYGLPGLPEREFLLLTRWLEDGAPATQKAPLDTLYQQQILQWELFLNGTSTKEKLMARYIYEHLFFANIYFTELPVGEYFNVVRSKTPSGVAIEKIASRRPFDDPGSAPFYYRLDRLKTTVVAKRHMPYRLDNVRLAHWQKLFLTPDYTVTRLPSYKPEEASNPFVTFKELPASARYQFMLDEAQFTISGFIKGPVCRGQIALNVINDHFWVLFKKPDNTALDAEMAFIEDKVNWLQMPAENGSETTLALARWLNYSKKASAYLNAKEARTISINGGDLPLPISQLWDGSGYNQNATLTIFRHFDSATVVKGLQGRLPKTAWVIDYPLLERIHYLLVSGFDVYGDAGHQLLTRLYMDFLRMEGERNFLALLPRQDAKQELAFWYRNVEFNLQGNIENLITKVKKSVDKKHHSNEAKSQLFDEIIAAFGAAVIPADGLNRPVANYRYASTTQQLQRLARVEGRAISWLPEQAIIRLITAKGDEIYTLLSNRAHSNVLSLLNENGRLLPDEQTVTVEKGIVGAYPNVFLQVEEADLPSFVDQLAALESEQDYRLFLDQFAIRRSDQRFWAFSDWLNENYYQTNPLEFGLLDYNRLENR